MARRSKLTPEQINATLFTIGTECGHEIYPSELVRLDSETPVHAMRGGV